MKTIVRNIVGPESKMYAADFAQADSPAEYGDVIATLGLSLEDVNDALRKAKQVRYLSALESTPDSIIATMVAAMVAGGFSPEEAKTISESKRESLGTGLPKGLKDLNRVSFRGRKSATDAEAEDEDETEETPAEEVAQTSPKPKRGK